MAGDNAVEWLRPPRFIPSDGIIRSYNYVQAEGGMILENLKNGEYTKTDEYVAHLVRTKIGSQRGENIKSTVVHYFRSLHVIDGTF